MKILAIRGKNLASLEGEFEVDFTTEPLLSTGIFAITGPTGSGKSTLLDALCVALFDETPRNNRTSENINIADVKDKTINQRDCRNILRRGTSDGYAEVDFISLGGEKFRSRWSVRRSRDKIDGTLQSTDFRLTNLSLHSEVQGRKTELLTKVVELIGLTFDQFTRAVLLAQGDFATFLKATQKEKAELLEKLTGTAVYSRISMSIYEKAKKAEQELNLLNERIKDIELLTEEEVETLTTEKQQLVTESEKLKKHLSVLTAKIKWINDEEILNHNICKAEEQLKATQNAIATAQPRYEYLAQIDRVQEIRDSYTELKRAEKQLAENQNYLTKQKEEEKVNTRYLIQATENVSTCETQLKQLLETYQQIEPLLKEARALDIRIDGARKNFKEAETEYNQTLKTEKELQQSAQKTTIAIQEAEKKRKAISTWLESVIQYKEIIPRIDLIVNLLDDATTAQKQKANNIKTLEALTVILDNEILQLKTLQTESERLNALLPAEIALLRAKLTEGMPCPVCGSLHHTIEQQEVESLEENKLNQAKEEVQNQIKALTESIEKRKNESIRLQSVADSYAVQFKESNEKLEGYLHEFPLWKQQFDQGKLQQLLLELIRKWDLCTQEQAKMEELIINLQAQYQFEQKNLTEISSTLVLKKEKLKHCETELKQWVEKRSSLLSGKSADETEKNFAQKNKTATDKLNELILKRDKFIAQNEKYSGMISQISSDISKLSERTNSLRQVIETWLANEQVIVNQEQLHNLLTKDSRWISVEREELNRLKENNTTARATLAERKDTLEKHKTSDSKPENEENKTQLQSILSEKEADFEEKKKRNTEIEIRLTNHTRGKEKLKIYEKELEEKQTLSDNWKKLNEVFGSADGAKFKVLAQGYTLDTLLTYANKHLQELSRRYELQRVPDTLALQVTDLDMLGEVRTVHSLSGGEAFLISLALALGLSSLSSNRMKVESLFIDEGFGSLDIDTLRIAMDALEQLQTQGRKIGVISHVAEMTERIATRIQVVKKSNGRSSIVVNETENN